MPSHSKPAAVDALVLLVDPSRHGLSARNQLLHEMGCQPLTAHTAEEGLQLLHDLPFDLVITGHAPPALDGITLIAALRHSGSTVPAILISGMAEPLGLDKRTTGADVVLQKSANEVHHLQRAVARLLSRKTVRKPVNSVGPLHAKHAVGG